MVRSMTCIAAMLCVASAPVWATEVPGENEPTALEIFKQRILPIFKSPKSENSVRQSALELGGVLANRR